MNGLEKSDSAVVAMKLPNKAGKPAAEVVDLAGKQIDHIDVPENWVGNLCFSGPDRKTLFIAASTSFYSIQLIYKGANPSK